MCMDEFIKRLFDFMGIYKIFWSQNSDYRYLPIFYRYLPIFTDILPIFTDILPIFYRYLPIFYRYFTDIYRYFTDIFSKISAQARVLHGRDFSVEKIGFFRFFDEKSAILPIFPRFFL